MAARSRFIAISLLFFLIGSATALISSETFIPSAPKAISDLRDAIVKGLGFQDLKVSGFDVRDALVGQSVAYEFDVEVDKKVFLIKLLEDMSRWDFFDLPIFKVEGEEEDKALAERGRSKKDSMVLPVLPPFELAGPMELWIQDGDDMRLSLPAIENFCWPDAAVASITALEKASHETLGSNFQKYNQKMRQLDFNLK